MKVTILKKGVKISLSDTEFVALRLMTIRGALATDKTVHNHLPSKAKFALRSERWNQKGGPLATVDSDHRDDGKTA